MSRTCNTGAAATLAPAATALTNTKIQSYFFATFEGAFKVREEI